MRKPERRSFGNITEQAPDGGVGYKVKAAKTNAPIKMTMPAAITARSILAIWPNAHPFGSFGL
jgi:hypothetical protein